MKGIKGPIIFFRHSGNYDEVEIVRNPAFNAAKTLTQIAAEKIWNQE
jgi:hypothetical protein